MLLLALLLPAAALHGQEPDSLNRYLQVAAANNPGLKAAFTTWQAALQRIPQTGALQDPQLELAFFLQPMELVEGRQIADLKLMQMFPWFGTRKAARTEAQHMAKMTWEQFRETRDGLFLNVATQWFTLCRLHQQLTGNEANRTLLLQLEALALQRFAAPATTGGEQPARPANTPADAPRTANAGAADMNGMRMNSAPATAGSSQPATAGMGAMAAGGGSMNGASTGMSDVLRIRMELTETESNAENLRSEIRAETAKFNALLNRPAGTDVRLPDSLHQTPFLLDIEQARTQLAEHNPMLGMIEEEEEAYRAKAEMDRKMSYPMLGLGLQYMLINRKTTDANGMDGMTTDANGMNGRDMLMPMISVSIPVYRSKYKAQQRENALLQQAGREKYLDTQNMLEAELYRTRHLLDDAARRITLYRRQTALAEATCNLMVHEFASGRGDLSGVIQVQRQLLDYALKTSDAVADYNISVATIRKLLSSNEE
jgi:outer membrane protein TolC